MPRWRPENRFFKMGDDCNAEFEALRVLRVNFTEKAGVFHRRDRNYQPTLDEFDAIDYLFWEWDYAYEE